MTNWAKTQAEFMVAGEQTVDCFNLDQARRYAFHVREETKELTESIHELACATNDDEHIAWLTDATDGAADVIVVALGFMISLGLNPDEVMGAVFAANMRKIVDGKIYRRDDGQIGKPPGWYGPEAELKKMVEMAFNQ